MAYDPVRKVTLLVGDVSANCETWGWDGLNWEKYYVEDLLMAMAMAYHPERQTIIRHGGGTKWDHGNAIFTTTSKTWEWNGYEWLPLPDGPSLVDHKMVYDPVRKKMIVFGGLTDWATPSNATWEFDGVSWTKVADTGPAGRQAFDMVYDSDRGVAVIFGGGLTIYGGFIDHPVQYNDMWQWDGSVWTRIHAEVPSNHNNWARMVYESTNKQIVLFGGEVSETDRPNDTWLFNFQQSGMLKRFWSNFR